MKKAILYITITKLIAISNLLVSKAQPDWPQIKANATFIVGDTLNYHQPEILPLNVGGWEDGLYVTRNGRHLYATYMPLDVLSWLRDWYLCMDFMPYYRGPLLDIDTVFNIFGCPNHIHSDIIMSDFSEGSLSFENWRSSELRKQFTFEGAPCGVLKNDDTFDVFVFTIDIWPNHTELMLMRDVPTDPPYQLAVPILSSPAHEDNPHIERLPNGDLLLFFDRDRYIYYSVSADNGYNWSEPVLVSNVLNDQAPYDTQPHLWFDGSDWWVYFSADNEQGFRSIYRSRQLIANDWDSWGPKELVLAPTGVAGGYANIIGIGEPTLTEWGDLYFVVVYGNNMQPDTTDIFDCDPWVMRRKNSLGLKESMHKHFELNFYPNPVSDWVRLNNVDGESMVFITDLSGRFVTGLICKEEGDGCLLDVSYLNEGVYIVSVSNKGVKRYGKLVIRH